MRKSMWMGSRARKRACLKWRRHQVLQAAGDRSRRLRTVLTAALGIEILVGSWMNIQKHPDTIRLIHVEEEYRLEWVQDECVLHDIYGIRLNPEALEIEFYRQQQEIP